MMEYPDIGSIRIDTSFTHPHSGGRDFLAEPVPRDRYSRHSGQAPSRIRDITWISTSQSQLPSTYTHTPQTPRYVPPSGFQQARTPTPPVLRKSAPTITESELELDAEYMTVSVDDRDECQYQGHGYGFSEVMPMPVATNGKSEKKNFVGGFVSGLRRLPKVMSKNRLRDHWKPERQGTGGTAASTIETPRTALPRYTGPSIMMPGIATSNSDDIPTVERLETPPRASSVSPHPRHVNPADSDPSIGDGRRERLMHSAVREHSFEQSHNSLRLPRNHSRSDDTSTYSRPPFEREGDIPNAMSTPILANASIRLSSPILAEPRPSADFMKMDSPIRPPPAESVGSQIARAGKFIRDLNGLPWVASSGVSSIYVPGEATTRRYSRPIHKNKGSWYTSRPKQLDLFAGPSTTGLLPPQLPPTSGMGHAQPVVPGPFILGSSANLLFTQPVQATGGGGSGSRSPSHEGPPSTDSHGSQAQVLAPAYVAQPLFVYPSGLPQPGGPPDAQHPRPVYMLANSPPHFMSGQDGGGGMGMGMPLGPRLFVPQPSGLRTPTFG
ncbi:hypothetical protein EV363DRAFT_1347128 [Boletus edulis]|uniref:Uncharacterized protein n=1 Tax=Boletus edulis BED1 TaxID=1328754 RepID=A0AAD4GNN3_BOLED|nr:hypothetical protein EV363DRAFT_1347128 [Boletus edulis]KAF8452904.1 hypothetical protein L210DRAFT_3519942 [Boletus edulis BED1]